MRRFVRVCLGLLSLAAFVIPPSAWGFDFGIAGRAGVPSDGGITCAACHGGGSFAGNLHLDLPETFAYDESYEIAVLFTPDGTDPNLWGFSLIAIDDATGEPVGGVGAGGISPGTGSQLSSFGSAGGWEYAVQTGNAEGGTTNLPSWWVNSGNPGWELDWTAPSSDVDSVTFYATFNAANGNEAATFDTIFEDNVTVEVPEPTAAAGLLVAIGALWALCRASDGAGGAVRSGGEKSRSCRALSVSTRHCLRRDRLPKLRVAGSRRHCRKRFGRQAASRTRSRAPHFDNALG